MLGFANLRNMFLYVAVMSAFVMTAWEEKVATKRALESGTITARGANLSWVELGPMKDKT